MNSEPCDHGYVDEETIRDSRAAQLHSCRQRIALFKSLQVDSQQDRDNGLEKIIQVVKSYIRSSRSPLSPSSPSLTDKVHSPYLTDTSITANNSNDDEYSEQLFYFLLTIVRLSVTCPYADVRKTFKELLKSLETSCVPIPRPRYKSPSHFISLYDVFSLESTASSYQPVLYPRSSALSFSPWSVRDEERQPDSADEEDDDESKSNSNKEDPSMPLESTIEESQLAFSDFTGGRPSDEYVRQMMIKTFNDEGRLANLFRVLAFFPTFFEIFHVTYSKITKTPVGSLHRNWKTYIGLMVAAEQQCQYLVSMLKVEFLYNGGDPNWLRGLDFVPSKLRNISTVILKLARQPWRLNTDDMHELLSGGLGEAWNKNELVQVILTASTYLGLSSFILGCGITPETDMTGGFSVSHSSSSNGRRGIEYELDSESPYSPSVFTTTTTTLQGESHAAGWQEDDDTTFSSDYGVGLGVSVDEECTEDLISKLKSNKKCMLNDQLVESLENVKSNINNNNNTSRPSSICVKTKFDKQFLDSTVECNSVYDELSVFIDTTLESIQLETFEVGHDEYSEFMLGEYCWEDHGCDLANHYMPDIGDDLVAEFTEALSITDWSIFHPVAEEVVDTSPLRNAIWFYTQKMMGVIKEDYNYEDIPLYLNDRTTQYIRSLCMSPHTIERNDWLNMGIALRPEEKCHVNLLIASARKQALLCYGLCLISEI
ncbi:hypothetical protein K501DRAFT_325973 [Backusella circina FSU 941]|nr:hypothetical protein K501DRAFT_325973 [Backusella circina FSU 941]